MVENEATPLLAIVFAAYAAFIVFRFGPEKLSRKMVIPVKLQEKSWIK